MDCDWSFSYLLQVLRTFKNTMSRKTFIMATSESKKRRHTSNINQMQIKNIKVIALLYLFTF